MLTDFTKLAHLISGDVITPKSPEYKLAIRRWSTSASKPALAVVFVKTVADVVQCLKFTRESGIDFSVKCGGHNSSGASSTATGIVIDLSRYMNKVEVDREALTAKVGGGALWEHVDKACGHKGTAAVGGTANQTGVSGLILGGGYSLLSGQRGLAIDNLISAQIVTQPHLEVPSVLTCSKEENTDLFWAIRGGGGNFGIMTEMTLKIWPQEEDVFLGTVSFDPTDETLEKFANSVQEWAGSKLNGKCHMDIGARRETWDANFFYAGTEAEGRENFKEIIQSLEACTTTRKLDMMPYWKTVDTPDTYSHRYLKQGFCRRFPNFSQLKAIRELHRNAASILEGMTIVEIEDRTMIRKLGKGPDGGGCFANREGEVSVYPEIEWKDEEGASIDQLAERYQMAKRLAVACLAAGVGPEDGGKTFQYANQVSDAGASHVAEALYKDNYPRLRKIKAKYDPEQRFNKWFPIEPEL